MIEAGTKTLVTGGGGFLGRAIVDQLLERGAEVRSFSRGRYPQLEALGVETRRGDLTDAGAVGEACRDRDVVFHVAALPGVWGPYRQYYETNVTGTENVLEACLARRVPRLVYTSTPSVVFDGSDMESVDESAPYPDRYHSAYPETKALAERAVLAADGDRLATVALRPHLIWGPGDPHLIPRLVERARAGALRIVGDGRNRVDTIYIDNAARAHVLAADRLAPGSPVAGKVYFISQGEPVVLWDFINRILAAAGAPPVTRTISASAAYRVGAAMEFIYKALRIRSEPRMTRFVARELSTSHWFDISAARRDLGFEPEVSIEEGLRRLAKSFAPDGELELARASRPDE